MRRLSSVSLLVVLAAACSGGGAHGVGRAVRVDVIMEAKASDREVAAVAAKLRTDRRVSSFRFDDHNVAYSESTKLFTGKHPVVSVRSSTPVASSFEVILRQATDASTVVNSYETLPGVNVVITVRGD
jgi:cell division protein FtsX